MASIMATAAVLLFALCGFGCAGDHIEYTPLDPGLVGKIIHFKEPIVYLVFSDKKIAKKYGFIYPKFKNKIIIRELTSQFDVNDIKGYFPDLPIETICKDMPFTIVGSYWQRGDWIRREFAPDIHSIVLRDINNIISVHMVSGESIQDSLMLNTDYGED